MAAVNIFKSQLIFLYHDVNKRAQSGMFEAERVFLSEYNPIYISYLYIIGSVLYGCQGCQRLYWSCPPITRTLISVLRNLHGFFELMLNYKRQKYMQSLVGEMESQ